MYGFKNKKILFLYIFQTKKYFAKHYAPQLQSWPKLI
jgi:hypothetical protein